MNRLHRAGECDECATHPATNPDGSVRHHYVMTPEEIAAGCDTFLTGPITGTFVVQGVEYDCTPPVAAVPREHCAELGWTIHKAHHARGNFTENPLPGDGSLDAFKADLFADAAVPEGDISPDE